MSGLPNILAPISSTCYTRRSWIAMNITLMNLFMLMAATVGVYGDQQASNCGLLGPQYPMPKNFYKSKHVKEAAKRTFDSIDIAISSGKTHWGTIDTVDTSFSLAVFSTDSEDLLFDYHHTGLHHGAALRGAKLNTDTLYRIGSVTKLYTAYTILARLGPGYWNEPLTKYIPQLSASPDWSPFPAKHPINWSQVTFGALASQMSGIGRDYGFFDISHVPHLPELGFPPLDMAEIPQCGRPEGAACTFEEALSLLVHQNAVSKPWHTPIYSNEGFSLLGLAVEIITGESFEQTFISSIVEPLNLKRTFWTPPPQNDTNVLDLGIMDAIEGYSFWDDLGLYAPTGAVYSSLGDLCTVGRSILRSDIISPSLTKEWMKPSTLTGHLNSAVGKPWEIARMEIPVSPGSSKTRLVDLYTKNGALGAYSSWLILSPDHEVGISVLIASNASRGGGAQTMLALPEMLLDTWITAAEFAAREAAAATFAGLYAATSTASGNAGLKLSVLELSMQPNRSGIRVERFIYNGTDVLSTLLDISGVAAGGADLQFLDEMDNGRQVAFRAIFAGIWTDNDDKTSARQRVLSKPCQYTWAGVDVSNYGNYGLDEFIFDIDEDGMAQNVTVPALRVTLSRQQDVSLSSDRGEQVSSTGLSTEL